MKKSIVLVTSLFMLFVIAISSCSKNNKEDIIAGLDPCDTDNVTYSLVIKPILDQFCNTSGCHNSTSVAAGYNFQDFNTLSTAALQDVFIGSIRHETAYSNMPKGGDKLTDCQISQIETWISDGAPNN